ncbi:2OG-Fe(II) oxygenase family protein [Erythrobacter sp. 3-20A1M]|uniref:2OG-Fe(II) oxygenase n=1 Tax=Erythrobacter sp. 3-20A1M TaxID=2653850 RepID=UPI00203A9EA0|nr:2OG-Fe(II) oxygenase family protein [Erythrobacter sp. 3-20A1M]
MIDRGALATAFERTGRVQVADLLTGESAKNLFEVLQSGTPWGLAWQAGSEGPHGERAGDLSPSLLKRVEARTFEAMRQGSYAFSFGQYRMLDAYLERWSPGSAHDALLEHVNAGPFLELVSEITGESGLIKADAQATYYGPGHFLSIHNDSHVGEGWKIAYVLNMCPVDWRPDWGGYLNFFGSDGNIEQGFRPSFNQLNLFRVPQLHNVSYIPPFAPAARFAVTGWCRDR